MAAEDDPTIITAMRSAHVDDAHQAARDLGRRFTRLADFLEDLGDLKSDDRAEIEAEFLLAKAVDMAAPYNNFARAVEAVRELHEEEK